MKLIYIAGPYTAATRWEIKQNIQYARAMAAQVIRIPGCFPVVPHFLGDGLEDLGDPEFWYQGTLELMRRCDAVLLVGDWWNSSKGTAREVEEAHNRGIPVFECLTELVQLSDMYKAGHAAGVERAKTCPENLLAEQDVPFPDGITDLQKFEFDCGFGAGLYAKDDGQALVPA